MDWVLAGLALAAFGIFVAIVGRFVPDPDLLIVLAAAVLMAAYDFWRSIQAQRRRRRRIAAEAAPPPRAG